MFENLTTQIKQGLQTLKGHHKFTEANTREALQTIKQAFLEADVALAVANQFLEDLRARILGEVVTTGLNPSDVFVKKAHEALTQLMGSQEAPLQLEKAPPVVLLIVGLQGVGKTTTVGKLTHWLKSKHKKSVLTASVDIYRPAAIQQLEMLTHKAEGSYHPNQPGETPLEIAKTAFQAAKTQQKDVLIIDTAGRLHTNERMMDELQQLQQYLNPAETLLVIDGMMGQDAAQSAQAFNKRLPLTGIILSKMEGDARGGAALSARFITEKPIKFIGTGEKIQALEPFYPERIASRILGMGDIVSLVEEVQRHTDKQVTQRLKTKIQKKQSFNLQDFLEQLQAMQKIGNVSSLLDKLPGLNPLSKGNIQQAIAPQQVNRTIAIICAMTPKERRFPHLLQDRRESRMIRITQGSGTTTQEFKQMLKQFQQAEKIRKRFSSKQKLKNLMQHISQF